jgi:hypothetical protein
MFFADLFMKSPKVFCIGFHKTGTSSIGLALERLGYKVAGYGQFRDLARRADLDQAMLAERAIEVARSFDVGQDSPWPHTNKRQVRRDGLLDAGSKTARPAHGRSPVSGRQARP